MDAAGPAIDGEPPRHHRVLIIGGGIVGLTLAQALRKRYPTTVKATVYERDPDPLARGAGWGLTIHWALSVFLELLPQDLVDRLEETFVDPVASKATDGNFAYYNLKTAEQRFRVPPARRIRVRRESLRRLLMEGVDIEVRLRDCVSRLLLPLRSPDISIFFSNHILNHLPAICFLTRNDVCKSVSGPSASGTSPRVQMEAA